MVLGAYIRNMIVLVAAMLGAVLGVILPEAQESSGPSQSRSMSEQERVGYEEKLRRWEEEQETLFEDLVAAVEEDDRIGVYYVLKRLHGGGAGPDGSEFELRKAEVEKRRIELEDWEKKLSKMRRVERLKEYGGSSGKEYRESVKNLEKRVELKRGSIAKLESEALEYAERAIVAELPFIFDILTGGGALDEGEVDPFEPPPSRP